MTLPAPKKEDAHDSFNELREILQKTKAAPIEIKGPDTLREASSRLNYLVGLMKEATQRKEAFVNPMRARLAAMEVIFDNIIAEASRQVREIRTETEKYWKGLEEAKESKTE